MPCLRLRQLARLDDFIDLQRELRLEQVLLRIGQAEVGEQVWLSLIPAHRPHVLKAVQ
jgi:hypothetical protein